MEYKSYACIIVIGEEILNGQRRDTNSGYIARRLTEAGIAVKQIISIGDDVKAIKNALSYAENAYGLAVLTGGLGPTSDDVTRPALADYFGLKLEFREDIYQQIKERFNQRGIKLAKNMQYQAEFPAGADMIHNEFGTAPGMFFRKNDFLCFSLPGVPREMEAMLDNFVLPALLKEDRGFPAVFKVFRTTGIAESLLAEKIGEWDIPQTKIAFLPSYMGVDVRIIAASSSAEEAESYFRQADKRLQETISEHIFGYDQNELAGVIGGILRRHGWKITVAESCTGGLLASLITDIPGASDYFQRGFITYSNDAKSDMLGVSEGLIEQHGAVSAEVAAAMAEGAAEWANADFALAVTGIAGPSGGSIKKPVGTTYIALLHPHGLEVEKHSFHDDRKINRVRSAAAALHLLYRTIKKLNLQPAI